MSVSHNELELLDFQQLSQMSLVKLDVSFNTLKLLSSSKQNINSIKELDLSNNRINKLIGCENLVNLVYLNVKNNLLTHANELNCLSNLTHLSDLVVAGNPFARGMLRRASVFARLHLVARQLTLDGYKMSRRDELKIRRHTSVSPPHHLISNTSSSSRPHHSCSLSVPTSCATHNIQQPTASVKPSSQTVENRQTKRSLAALTLLEKTEMNGRDVITDL
ncbi:serine/threonine-protein kinase 11-interacting protein-like [Corticium candelabrum]|uniref:serine/threonine-protein kinase 11-interacting protein-like n=1 Tax=Corticium candelabrum TaxID=121492 RepID=UPI002E26B8AA|nr:serine/threonine-protein kinase 11-interacting protein-like [Corticium candelabrum]